MLIFDNTPKHKEKDKVRRSDIQYLTHQLHRFIHLYETRVCIEDSNVNTKLGELKQLLQLLEDERYDLLMNDPSIISDDCVPLDPITDDDSFPI